MINPLKLKRLEKGLTQYQVAYATGVPQVKLSYAERGYPALNLKQRMLLAEYFGSSVEDLFGEVAHD